MGFSLLTSFHVSAQLNRLCKATQIHYGFSPPPLIPVSPHLPAKHGINVHFSNKKTEMHPLIWPKPHRRPGLELSSMWFKLSVFTLNLMIPSNQQQQQQPHCGKSCKLTRAAHIETFPASAVSAPFSHVSDIPGHHGAHLTNNLVPASKVLTFEKIPISLWKVHLNSFLPPFSQKMDWMM